MSTIKNIKRAGNYGHVMQSRNKNNPPIPPAYFLSVDVENVRCFGHKQTLDLSDSAGKPAQWTVILGENGVGKTTLLQCVAAFEAVPCPSGLRTGYAIPRLAYYSDEMSWRPFRSVDAPLACVPNSGSCIDVSLSSKVFYGARLYDNTVGEVLEGFRFSLGPDGGGFVYEERSYVGGLICYGYGASRRAGKTSLSEKSENYGSASLFDEDAPLLNAEEWLLQADYAASKPSPIQKRSKERRDRVKTLLIDLLPEAEDIKISQLTEEQPTPQIKVKTPYGWVSIRDLSLGYKTLIAWMVDLAHRLFERYPDSPNPLAEPAIVLVDEIDLHLHPKWQRELIGYLTKKFVNTQFIVTAHSPLVVQSATNANIVLLRREGDHVVIDNNVESIRNWRIDQILTSDLYGLKSARPPQIDELMAKRNQLLSKGKFTKRDEKELHRLEEQIGPLPVGETPKDIEAMDIIRRAAERLKK